MQFTGLEAELYYVQDGNVKNYALNFVVPIPSNIDALNFTWESLAGQPVCILIKKNTELDYKVSFPATLFDCSRNFECTSFTDPKIKYYSQRFYTDYSTNIHNIFTLFRIS